MDNQPQNKSGGIPRITPRETTENGPVEALLTPKTYLSSTTALALIFGLQIGAGIFSVPSVVLVHALSSPPLALTIWFLGGVLASTGAACILELGIAIPVNGGLIEYVRHCWGDRMGFVASWMSVGIVQPLSMALVSLIGAGYVERFVTILGAASGSDFYVQDFGHEWYQKMIAVVMVLSVTILNCAGTRIGAGTAKIFLVMKVAALVSIIIAGIIWALKNGPSGPARSTDHMTVLTSTSALDSEIISETGQMTWQVVGSLTDAVLSALLTYQGWENVGYIVGELRDPGRTLPRVLGIAMTLITVLFVSTNMAFMTVVPIDIMAESDTLALDFGYMLFGTSGALVATLVVALSVVGALNAKIFAIGRLTEAAAKRKYLPVFFGMSRPAIQPPMISNEHSPLLASECITTEASNHCEESAQQTNSSSGAPVRAMLLNATLATICILFSSFRILVTYASLTAQFIFLLAVSGLLVYRSRLESRTNNNTATPTDDEATTSIKPYRTFVALPIVFCAVEAFIVARGALQHPWFAVGVVGINAAALLGYIHLRDSHDD